MKAYVRPNKNKNSDFGFEAEVEGKNVTVWGCFATKAEATAWVEEIMKKKVNLVNVSVTQDASGTTTFSVDA